MRPACDLLKSGLVLADGAMGTYYAQISSGDTAGCEQANITRPDLVRQIHRQYLDAGSRFLRTNTFATTLLYDQPQLLRQQIRAGYQLAADCAGDLAFVAADIGPSYDLDAENSIKASLLAAETFLECAADLFIFETFADPDELLPVCRQIKLWQPQAVIIASFALSPDGLTRKGLPLSQIADVMENSPEIDIWGLNCSMGPTHMAEQARRLGIEGKPLSLMPNGGYPRLENQRLVYGTAPAYFAQVVAGLADGRTRLLGGCCGTTPRHIEALSQALAQCPLPKPMENVTLETAAPQPSGRHYGPLADKLAAGHFTVICELDPPRDSHMAPLIAAARNLRQAGIDAITLADSPMARVKLDSIVCAARLFRDTGVPVLPHLCCRDRNVNSLRASLLAAHSEGIRQVLAITGDAIPESERGFIKPVFNVNSIGLLQMIRQMNQDQFAEEPLLAFAAVDPGVPNLDAEYVRVCRKKEQGAQVFLSQPVFDSSGLPLIRRMRADGIKVLIGLMPLVSYRNAQFMSHEVPGIRIPGTVLERFSPDMDKSAAIETGLSITRELAALIRADADGFYLITPFNRSELIIRLLDGLRADNLL
ncbi:MAG: bifunctional homocysteine S-methyltransferase/methylenetetrahydrofolate reductase [Clostridiaceae bacterium]|nr:bifunctional homocysteine S-methyltransferase/methylenetetrahydrofolate reductase [Clostridiaceae bacterium]